MFFPIPHPTYWDDPGPYPVSSWRRWLWQTVIKASLFPIRRAWIEQWQRHMDYLAEQAEAYQIWLDQQAAWEIMMEEYRAQGEHWSENIPGYLHHMGLSYRRTVRERKEDRPYEKVDYCQIEYWYFDEYAYYFWVVTWPLPYGLKIAHFQPNTENSEVAETLAGALGTHVTVEFNPRGHERQGLWIIAEHKTGRGKIPLRISYQQCLAEMPKGAKQLAFPIGHATHNRGYIADLGEVTNLLIGGSQGGGKSNILNVILSTFITRNNPNDLRLFLCDFKRVEFAFYKGIPHLGGDVPYVQKMREDENGKLKPGPIRIVSPDCEVEDLKKPLGKTIITEGHQLVNLLNYALAEIERRTNMLEGKVRKIDTWNKRFPHRKLSRWVIVIDELADVMLQQKLGRQVEPVLVRIAQLGRAMGVHLILATQTPKNEVVSLLIQNNIINRIVFRCGTGQASGVMLDGRYEAARLIPNPGRAIFREGASMIELQTPEITDLTVRKAVKDAKQGKTSSVIDEKSLAVPPDKIFEYALKELDGYCAVKDLYHAFRRKITQKEMEGLLKEYEVAGTPPALEPEIEVNEEQYYLAPSPGGRVPRQLIPVQQFIADFETQWAEKLASRVSYLAENGKTGAGDNSQNGKTAHPGKLDREPGDSEPVEATARPEPQTQAGDGLDWVDTL